MRAEETTAAFVLLLFRLRGASFRDRDWHTVWRSLLIMPNNNDKIETEARDAANWSPISAARQHAGRKNEDDDERIYKYNDDDNNMPDPGSDLAGLAVVITSPTEDASEGPTCDAGNDVPEGAFRSSVSDDCIGDESPATPSNTEDDDVNVNSGISRLSEPTVSTSDRRTKFRNQKQDEFVTNGARVKSLISTVLRIVVDGIIPSSGTDHGNEENESGTVSNTESDNQHTNIQTRYTNTDIAQARTEALERSEECFALKRVSIISISFSFLDYLYFFLTPTEPDLPQINPKEGRRVTISDRILSK